MKSTAYLMLHLSITVASANDFPAQQVEYHCRTAMHYITYTQSECISEQNAWFDRASKSPHYDKALWYGQHRNWRGDVVGVDFKPIMERINYLDKQ